jgi:TPP-dependent trihydroxycyclohexane-1,2-dione (THcHDO) dehydratase
MAVQAVTLVASKQAENAQTTQYTSTNCTTIIDKATITNTTTGIVTFAANLVTAAGAAGAANLIVSRSIAPKETYALPELVGQVLQPSDFLSTIAGAATSLTLRVSGRQITN